MFKELAGIDAALAQTAHVVKGKKVRTILIVASSYFSRAKRYCCQSIFLLPIFYLVYGIAVVNDYDRTVEI